PGRRKVPPALRARPGIGVSDTSLCVDVAYRMLGSLSAADDAVQEARFRLSRSDAAEIGAPPRGGAAGAIALVAPTSRANAAERAWRCAWTSWTAHAPSPTAVAHRLVEPERTSPTAKTPGTDVSSRLSAPTADPVRMNPFSSRPTTSPSQSVQGSAPRNRNR